LPGESHGQRSLAATVQRVAKRWTQLSKKAHTHNEYVEKSEPSCTVDGNVNWYNHYGRQSEDFSKN